MKQKKKGESDLKSILFFKKILLPALIIVSLSACGISNGTNTINNEKTQPISSEKISSEKPTLIYFMASWCPTCVAGEKVFKQIHNKYGNNVQLITVDMDPQRDTEQDLKDFQRQYGGEWTHLIDKEYELTKKYQVKQLEEVFLIDSNQEVVYHAVNPSFDDLQKELTRIGVSSS